MLKRVYKLTDKGQWSISNGHSTLNIKYATRYKCSEIKLNVTYLFIIHSMQI